jgi:hypothetical protein
LDIAPQPTKTAFNTLWSSPIRLSGGFSSGAVSFGPLSPVNVYDDGPETFTCQLA